MLQYCVVCLDGAVRSRGTVAPLVNSDCGCYLLILLLCGVFGWCSM
jgi:hypothetical protein